MDQRYYDSAADDASEQREPRIISVIGRNLTPIREENEPKDSGAASNQRYHDSAADAPQDISVIGRNLTPIKEENEPKDGGRGFDIPPTLLYSDLGYNSLETSLSSSESPEPQPPGTHVAMGNAMSKIKREEDAAYDALKSAMNIFANNFQDPYVNSNYKTQRLQLREDVLKERHEKRMADVSEERIIKYAELLHSESKLHSKICAEEESSKRLYKAGAVSGAVSNFIDDGDEADDEGVSESQWTESQLPPYSYFAENPPPPYTIGGIARRLSSMIPGNDKGANQAEMPGIITNQTFTNHDDSPVPTHGDPIYAAAKAANILYSPISSDEAEFTDLKPTSGSLADSAAGTSHFSIGDEVGDLKISL